MILGKEMVFVIGDIINKPKTTKCWHILDTLALGQIMLVTSGEK